VFERRINMEIKIVWNFWVITKLKEKNKIFIWKTVYFFPLSFGVFQFLVMWIKINMRRYPKRQKQRIYRMRSFQSVSKNSKGDINGKRVERYIKITENG
jgi:hypothetical protein